MARCTSMGVKVPVGSAAPASMGSSRLALTSSENKLASTSSALSFPKMTFFIPWLVILMPWLVFNSKCPLYHHHQSACEPSPRLPALTLAGFILAHIIAHANTKYHDAIGGDEHALYYEHIFRTYKFSICKTLELAVARSELGYGH
ncbi:hypothetical protein EDB19DRAFT_1730985 [Suillus lakei]|nr:hypothetical protein EDB19DRAFT_1730985 [Suillus lakei]